VDCEIPEIFNRLGPDQHMTTITATAQKDPKTCQLHVGTSGYSYTEWVKAGFYLSDTKTGKMLEKYARFFSITELNYKGLLGTSIGLLVDIIQ
jgi:hypothetical protein